MEELEGETATGGGSAANVDWSTRPGKVQYGAGGERDTIIIIIVSCYRFVVACIFIRSSCYIN